MTGWRPAARGIVLGLLLPIVARGTSAPADEEWRPEVFDYDRPIRLDVHEEAAPSDQRVAGARQDGFVFKNVRDEEVHVLLTRPGRGAGPFPVVILLHGFGGNRVEVTHRVAPELIAKGFACLALDLPFHGARGAKPRELFVEDDPEKTFRHIVHSVMDTRQAIDFAESRKELDTSKGVFLVGYSMGAWFGALTGAAERRVEAMILMVGGSAAEEESTGREAPSARGQQDVLQRYVAIRPLDAIPGFAPRPILMQNGRRDLLVPEERARALYRAAKPPKELRWYDSGHLLPTKAYEDAAEWLLKHSRK